jgi:hypothetical protein
MVEGMLPRRGTALLSGQCGTYKTFVALDLVVAVMTGTTFAGRKVNRQGGVLFIAVEGQDDIRPRLTALIEDKVKKAIADGEIPEGSVDPKAMPFAWVETCPKLSADDALPKFRSLVTAAAEGMQKRFGLPLALGIIDTLSPAAGFKNADDTSENEEVMGVLSKVGKGADSCVVAVDHFGKDVSTGTRNSSVKESHVDIVLALLGERSLGGIVSNPRMAIRKNRFGPTGAEIKFSKRDVVFECEGRAHTSLVIDWDPQDDAAENAPKQPKGSKALKIFKRALDTMLADAGRTIRPWPDGPEVQAVNRERVREEFYKIYPAENAKAKKQAFERKEQEAVASRMMVSRELDTATWFWLPKKKRQPDEPHGQHRHTGYTVGTSTRDTFVYLL